MKTSVEVVTQTFKVFLLFIGCTILFYYGILWIHDQYENFHRYDEPMGKAMKVMKVEEDPLADGWVARLLQFYQSGE